MLSGWGWIGPHSLPPKVDLFHPPKLVSQGISGEGRQTELGNSATLSQEVLVCS